jgi:cellobiose transport system permease protein
MQAVSGEVYEAAKVDGAGPIRSFFSITIPLLRPTIIFVLIVSTITGLQTFSEPQVLTASASTSNPNSGGNGQGGLTMALYFYQQAFGYNKYGYGASIAWGIFAIVFLFVMLSWWYSRKREDVTL